MAAKGTTLEQAYPNPADRPQQCWLCQHDATNHMGTSNFSWCAIAKDIRPAAGPCDQNAYVAREQSPEELAHLQEISKGTAFSRLRTQLIEQAAEGTRELVEFDKGLFMSPTPGKKIVASEYPEDAA